MRPDIESIRWLAIGLALANTEFAKRLSNEVGFRAFEGPSQEAFYGVEIKLAGLDPTKSVKFAVLAQEEPESRISEMVLRLLREEAEINFATTAYQHDHRKIATLAKQIADDSAKLLSWSKRISN